MDDILFLDLEEIFRIHENQIERYGGSHGIRSNGLLESALSQPTASFGGGYVHIDLYEMAAAYLFHIVKNHPFIDGNKRVAGVAAQVFLGLNGYRLEIPEEEFERLVFNAAQSLIDKPGIAEVLRKHCVPMDNP